MEVWKDKYPFISVCKNFACFWFVVKMQISRLDSVLHKTKANFTSAILSVIGRN